MKFIYLSILACSLMFVGCKKSDTSTPLTGTTFIINATSETQWVYFSFDKNDSVKISDPKNSTGWDIAFKRFYVRSNGGLSGIGSAGADSANVNGQTGFDSYKSVTSTNFSTDKYMQVMTYMGYGMDTVNPVLYTWFNYNFGTNTLVPTNMVFIVKTASGNYAKVWIESYYSDLNVPGYVKFKYVYLPDGSKSF